MREANIFSLNKKFNFEAGSIFLSFAFILFVGYFFYKIINSYFNVNFIIPDNQKKVVYLLKSEDTMSYLEKQGYGVDNYLDRLKLIKKYLSKEYSVKTIKESQILSMDKKSILLAFDVFNLSESSKNIFLNFLENGGKLIFNYHFGYFINNKFQGDRLLSKITSLKSIMEAKKKTDIFITPNLMSPISSNIINAKKFDYILYDKIPIFQSAIHPDAVMSNWQSTSTPVINGKELPLNEAGVMWHGNYKKGYWIYFTFPSYTLTDDSYAMFNYFLNNSIKFLNSGISIIKYPYILHKKIVFISQDTEYQYQNLKRFSNLMKKYKTNATAFCVGYLAEKYPNITKEASQNPYLEIGSHSYSHAKIVGTGQRNMVKETLGSKLLLEKLTSKKVIGFRPPREEIDSNLSRALVQAGYIYTMEKFKPFLYPKEVYKKLITIPRHGTDDYEYIINLDWDKDKILNKIIKETDFLTNLHLLYTLSIHTHLMSYGKNIDILEGYLKYLQNNKSIKPLQGKEIAQISKYQKNIDISYDKSLSKIFIKITNNNKVKIKNFTFRIYYNGLTKIDDFTSEIIGIGVKSIKQGKNYIDIRISELRPRSTIVVMANYQ